MMIHRRCLVLPALIALAARNAMAFTPVGLGGLTSTNTVRFSMVASDTDVSVEYDSAARLAYKGWCAKFGKDASESRFESFKANYEAITVANVSAAKKARDEGTERPKDLDLNEFGDMSEEEYMRTQAGGDAALELGALKTVVEASVAQSDASIALAEAADALAQEEEELAKALGLNSVAELEQAIDAIEGFDTDGGALDTTDVREARVRSVYMDWCKDYGKQPDESRFPTFSSNFLAMEEYASENGKEMTLNKYADCTEEEYRKLTNTEVTAPELVVVEKEPDVEMKPDAPAPEIAVEKAPVSEKLPTEPKKEEPVVVAIPEKPKPIAKAPEPVEELSLEEEAIKLAKAAAEAEASQVAKRRALDEQAAQIEREKAAEAMKKQQRATTMIEPPKIQLSADTNIFSSLFKSEPKKQQLAEIKKQVVGSSERSPVKTKVEETKTKASPPLSLFQPKGDTPTSSVTPVSPPKITQKSLTAPKSPPTKPDANIFSSLFKSDSKVEKKIEVKVAPIKQVPDRKSPTLSLMSDSTPIVSKSRSRSESSPAASKDNSLFSFFSPPPSSKKEPVAAPKPVAVDKKPAPSFGSFFGGSSAPKPIPKAAPLPVKPIEKAPAKGSGTFSLFGGPASPAATTIASRNKAAPARKAVPTISLLGDSTPKVAPKASSTPAAQKGTGTFSLFSAPPAVKKAPPSAPKPVAVTKQQAPAFGGLFGGSAAVKPAPKVPPKPVIPVEKVPAKGSGTFSLFGGPATPAKTGTPVAQSSSVQKKASVKRDTSKTNVAGIGGLSSFATPKKPINPARVPAASKARGSGTISISSPPKKSPPTLVKGGGISIFGGFSSTPSKPTPVPKPVKPKTPSKPSDGFSLFGGPPQKKAPADNIPIVGKFKQNADGSITGIVRNSNNFRSGTEITTSPVRRGARAGDLVTTSSGSKYRLE